MLGRSTKRCVYCFEKATVWTGHVKHKDGGYITAGWCKKHKDQLTIPGFYGHYKKKFGFHYIED